MIEEMLKETTVWKCGRNGESRRFYGQEKWCRILWDLLHPESPCAGFDIHHRDNDTLNDNPDNLQRLTHKEHAKLHGLTMLEETKNKISISMTGENNPNYGKQFSNETKQKMSLTALNMSKETKQKMSIANTDENNPNAKAVNINGQIFPTRKASAKYLNVTPQTIRNRILANKPGYSYYTGEE